MGIFDDVSKYDIEEEENIPQYVYGIPDFLMKEIDDESKNRREVFNAFEGKTGGFAAYFFIDSVDGEYEFKYGLSDDGSIIFNDNDSSKLTVFTESESYYKRFVDDLKSVTEKWEISYFNDEVKSSVHWYVEYLDDNKKYTGTNSFPNDYDEMRKVLNNYFKIETEPSDDELKGIFKDANCDTNMKKEKEAIRFFIENEMANYTLKLNYFPKSQECSLVFANLNKVSLKDLDDMTVKISKGLYQSFADRLDNLIKEWQDVYSGDDKVTWCINIDTLKKKREIFGRGGFPSNWNKLIDLVAEYEKLFKKEKR